MTDTPTTIDGRRTALLVMDCQNGILDSFEGTTTLLAHAADAIAQVREHGGRIGYVRVGFTEAELAAIPATSPMAAVATPGRREAMHADSPATAVHDRIAPGRDDIVVRKTRVGAFSTTDLDQRLREAGINTLILAGVATSGVVLSTVREAADRDYRLAVLSDACADADPEVHDCLTRLVFPKQAIVLTTEELESLLD